MPEERRAANLVHDERIRALEERMKTMEKKMDGNGRPGIIERMGTVQNTLKILIAIGLIPAANAVWQFIRQ